VRVADSGPAALDAVRHLLHVRTLLLVPLGLTVREPSLDDVFLALTGHAALEQRADVEEVG
jgi:hypothetical protein